MFKKMTRTITDTTKIHPWIWHLSILTLLLFIIQMTRKIVKWLWKKLCKADHCMAILPAFLRWNSPQLVEIQRNGMLQNFYATLDDAIKATQSGDTLKIMDTIDLGNIGVMINGKALTLDLNGQIITYHGSGHAIKLENNGAGLTVTDSGKGGKLIATGNIGRAIYNDSNGDITILGGTVLATGDSGTAISNYSTGDITISGGTVSATGIGGWAISNGSNGDVIISGGTVSATGGGLAIWNYSTSDITILDGTVSATGDVGTAIYNYSTSNINVSGGTVSATGNNGKAIYNDSIGKITINDGATITAEANVNSGGTIYLRTVPDNVPKTMLFIQGGIVKNTADPEGYSIYFDDPDVTKDNVGDYYIKSGGTVGKIYPAKLSALTQTITVYINEDNTTATITNKEASDAIQKAEDEIKKNHHPSNDITLLLNVKTDKLVANSITIHLPKLTQEVIISKKVTSIMIVIDNFNIRLSMDLAAIMEMHKQAESDISITAARIHNGRLTGKARSVIGNRPVYDIAVSCGKHNITDFVRGSVHMAIPYILQAGEAADGLTVVSVNGDNVSYLTNSSYDIKEKMMHFSIKYLSVYGIAYKAPVAYTGIIDH